jgi:hypothetical protein
MTWLLVTIKPDGSTITPEPSDCSMRGREGPLTPGPKKNSKNGSPANGDCRCCTMRAA